MAWVMVATMGAGALLGARKENLAQEQTKAQNLAQAEMTRYSPWTGMKGQVVANNHDAMSGALAGGLGGLQLGQAVMGANGKPVDPNAKALGLNDPSNLQGTQTSGYNYNSNMNS